MEQRKLGKSGLSASVIGLGCWQLGGDFGPTGVENSQQILSAADTEGITFWDTADVYGGGESEKTIGYWQREHQQQRTIVTKLGRDASLYPDKYTPENMQRSIEGSLERLQVNCIDLIQLHCIPPAVLEGDAVWQALEDFRSQGLIKHYGASVENIKEGLICLDKPGLTSLQIIFNLCRQDAVEQLLPQAAAADVGIIARLPLASGLLSGKFALNTEFSKSDHRNYNKDGAFFNVGETFSGLPYAKAIELVNELKGLLPADIPLAQLALRWIVDQPQITSVISGASSAAQVKQNAAVAGMPPLSAELHKRLSEFYYLQVKEHVRGDI